MHSNPLWVQCFSNVPFLLGEGQAVQYSLKPTRAGRSRIPIRPAENYLRDAMDVEHIEPTGEETFT